MTRARSWIFVVVAAVALVAPGAARAEPPANDNRAAAQAIPTFPAAVAGTTLESTVERLDPQVSKCGQVDGTVWYRIDQAPDGTVALALQAPGFAPVVRVYTLAKSGITELACVSAKVGAEAQLSSARSAAPPTSSSSAASRRRRTRPSSCPRSSTCRPRTMPSGRRTRSERCRHR